MNGKKKKINLIGCLLMGTGCIVGSGIFGTLPEVAREIGPGLIYALIGAAVVVILRSISRMYTSAALPTSASTFMYASKLMHPGVGAMISINAFLQPTMVSLFGVLFSVYFQNLFPAIEMNSTLISVGLLVVFTLVAWFGNKTSVTASNVMVILLLGAIALYIILGMPKIDAEHITFLQIVKPGIALSSLSAAIGVLTSSLSGASSVAEIADDVENPGKNVPITLILCPVIVAVVYILMAVVTIGVVPYAEVQSLSQVAEHFLSPALLTFFIVGGPLAGIITSLVPVALACVAAMSYSAKTKFLPEVFCRENRHGVPVLSLLVVSAIAIGICATGATFGVIMTVFSFTNTLGELPNTLSPIFAYRKYPKSCQHSSVPMGKNLAAVLAVITFLICAYLCVQMALTLDKMAVAGILSVYLAGYLYFFLRTRYLRNRRDIDLIAEMGKAYQPWQDKEASYR